MVRSFVVAVFATLLMAFTGSAFAQSSGHRRRGEGTA